MYDTKHIETLRLVFLVKDKTFFFFFLRTCLPFLVMMNTSTIDLVLVIKKRLTKTRWVMVYSDNTK